ncbi:Zinc finger, SWIM-type [Parasponia andersonii]|uniref:Zinc finger, SWIM-type n=1 Tax=Parasponia andersonii TaxID=3476 RepID=A0A2P5DKC7_PARAD|nr:Zinc finger, SWIM-type [Parasponia andersonii]
MKMMTCLHSRATTIARWDQVLTLGVRYRVNKLLNQARSARVYHTCDYEFQVDYDERRVKVSLNDRSCDCGQWEVRGIPCVHSRFNDDQLLAPPKLVRPPDRPKKHRRRNRDEARPVTRRSATVKCGRCGIYDHNERSCQGPSTRINVGRKAKGKRPTSTVVDQPT